jgi:hypothetical protein
MPQTDRHSQVSSDVAVEGVYTKQIKDPSDITLQRTFQQGLFNKVLRKAFFPAHFSDYLNESRNISGRHYSTRYYGRHFFPRHFSDFRNEGRSISGRHCSTRYHGRTALSSTAFFRLPCQRWETSTRHCPTRHYGWFFSSQQLFKPAYRTEELFSKVLPQDHFYTELIGKKDL